MFYLNYVTSLIADYQSPITEYCNFLKLDKNLTFNFNIITRQLGKLILTTNAFVLAYAYGMVTVKFVVANILRKYRVTTNQEFNNLPLDLFFMYKPSEGFLVKLEPRSVTC